MKNSYPQSVDFKINPIREQLGHGKDLSIQRTRLYEGLNGVLISTTFLSSPVNKAKAREMSPEINRLSNSVKSIGNKDEIYLKILQNILLCGSGVSTGSNNEEMLQQILEGSTVILFDEIEFFPVYITYRPEGRATQEPTSQTVTQGPEEGFIEKVKNDIFQIRRRIKDKSLRAEPLKLGTITKTDVALLYMEGITLESNIKEVRKRPSEIQIDGILESQNIEELIRDDMYLLSLTIYNTERPDNVPTALLEGKIAIIADGTPHVLTVPTIFIEFFISSEDYYHSIYDSALFRLVRLLSFFLTVFVPDIYITLTTLDQELIPTPLLPNITAQCERVPPSTFWEGILMEVTFKILREAGTRVSRAIGPAISIVGVLVLEQAAVQAGLVSIAMVIVVSITTIASFYTPNTAMADALRMTRFTVMVPVAYMGLYGIFICMFGLVLHLCKLKSIGAPHMAPAASVISKKSIDHIFRVPLWARKKHSSLFNKTKKLRNRMDGPT